MSRPGSYVEIDLPTPDLPRVWAVFGRGRCEGTVAWVLARTPHEAVKRLTADCFSPFFEVAGVAEGVLA